MIYYILSDGMVKIGYTAKSAKLRMKEVIGLRPGDHELLGSHPGNLCDEKNLHKHFSKWHLSGEWFLDTPVLREHIRVSCTNSRFNALTEIEPRLLTLYTKAISTKSHKKFCANAVWFGWDKPIMANERIEQIGTGLKGELAGLVGYHALEVRLQNSEAYDIAYKEIYSVLPGCQECGCARLSDYMVA